MNNLLFALETFRRHMDNGKWLLQLGMEQQGYISVGHHQPYPNENTTDVRQAVEHYQPKIVIFWPRIEWQDYVLPEYHYRNWQHLHMRPDILRVAIWHDAASAVDSQTQWHGIFKPHYYLTWYHAQSVLPYGPAVKPEQLIRTYHVIDKDAFPLMFRRDKRCVISGALNKEMYPFRSQCAAWAMNGQIGPVDVIRHPGYPCRNSLSDVYARWLADYRVAICTASAYDFSLRKIFEATAAGCRVITNLSTTDYLPEIDDNLIRVNSDITAPELTAVIDDACTTWNFTRQRDFAHAARTRYDYRNEYQRLATVLDEKALK